MPVVEKIRRWSICMSLVWIVCLCSTRTLAQQHQQKSTLRQQHLQKPGLRKRSPQKPPPAPDDPKKAVRRQIQQLLDQGTPYVDRPDPTPGALDSALTLFTEARRLSQSIKDRKLELDAIYSQAIVHVETHDFALAKTMAAPLPADLYTLFMLELSIQEAKSARSGDKDSSHTHLRQLITLTGAVRDRQLQYTCRRYIVDHYLSLNDTSSMQRLLTQWYQDAHHNNDLYNELYYTGQLSWYFPNRVDYFHMQMDVRKRIIESHTYTPKRTQSIIDSVATLFTTKIGFVPGQWPLVIQLYHHAADFSMGDLQFQYTNRRAIVDYYLGRNDTTTMQKLLMQWYQDSRRNKDLYNELYYTGQLSWYFPYRDDYFNMQMDVRKRFIESHLYSPQRTRAIIDSVTRLFAQKSNYVGNDRPLSVRLYQHAMDFTMGNMKIFLESHEAISYLYSLQGNLTGALTHALAAVRCMEKCDTAWDKHAVTNPYTMLARVYLTMEDWNSCIEYSKKALALNLKVKNEPYGYAFKNMTIAYLNLGRPQEALDVIRANIHNPRPNSREVAYIDEALGDCYTALGQYALAEKYYTEGRDTSKNINKNFPIIFQYAFARLYTQAGHYDKAWRYAAPIVSDTSVPVSMREEVYLLLSRLDSARGDYGAAYTHLQQHKHLHDSMLPGSNTQQVASIITQYETEKKDQDIQLKDQSIQLLTRQGELQTTQLHEQQLQYQYDNEQKQHSLEVLRLQADKKDKELQLAQATAVNKDKDLQQTRFTRNVLIGGALLLFLVLGLVYNRYRIKQRSNRLLQQQQERIHRSNMQLQQLNQQQRKLLAEKEWLVKEIHHRVKNNLQIVMSLLNMQSQYLSDEYALNAFGEVSHRMQAISLIHQKLYQTDGMAHIDMPVYIREMVTYLQHGSVGRTPINFNIDVEDIQLEVAQCVPLGLILNETLTNAIKYAFIGRTAGNNINISLHRQCDTVVLTVADNGWGLPEDFDITRNDSLGFQLIQTLTEQLEGTLDIDNKNGLAISVRFIGAMLPATELEKRAMPKA